MPLTSRSRVSVALVTAALTTVGLASALGASPAGAASTTKTRTHALATGVKVSVRDFRLGGRPEHVTLMSINLADKRLHVDSVTPGNQLGAPRQTATTLIHRNKALGGINTAFFDLHAKYAVPRDGVIRAGKILKTPRRTWDANLYVTRTGLARVGRINFHGTLTRAARSRMVKAASQQLYAVNSIGEAQLGRITLITSSLMAPEFGAKCAVAFGHLSKGKRVITRTYAAATKLRRMKSGEFSLVSCGKGHTSWLRTQVHVKDVVTLAMSVDGGIPRTLVSGGRKLVDKGKAFNDVDGKTFPGNPRNPETFACASRDGRTLLIGTVDGRQKTSAGMTLGEVGKYLLSLHCWSGLVFDGGGSSTIVGRSSTRAVVKVLNRPSGGKQREIVAGLAVLRS